MVSEIRELKKSNEKIYKCVQDLKTENSMLKKLINDQFRFKNFNLYNRELINDQEDSDAVFESDYSQKGTKKRKTSHATSIDSNRKEEVVALNHCEPTTNVSWKNVVGKNSKPTSSTR